MKIEKTWFEYPKYIPEPGWCAVSDGGSIDLMWWGGTKWVGEPYDVLEFHQVTEAVKPVESKLEEPNPISQAEDTGKHEALGTEIGRMVDTKNRAYGDSFARAGDVLRQMYPYGVKPEQYDDMLAVVRIIDKLFRIATDKDALGESPFRDIAGYGLLGAGRKP